MFSLFSTLTCFAPTYPLPARGAARLTSAAAAPPPPQLYSTGSEHSRQRVLSSDSPGSAHYSTPSQRSAASYMDSSVGSGQRRAASKSLGSPLLDP